MPFTRNCSGDCPKTKTEGRICTSFNSGDYPKTMADIRICTSFNGRDCPKTKIESRICTSLVGGTVSKPVVRGGHYIEITAEINIIDSDGI